MPLFPSISSETCSCRDKKIHGAIYDIVCYDLCINIFFFHINTCNVCLFIIIYIARSPWILLPVCSRSWWVVFGQYKLSVCDASHICYNIQYYNQWFLLALFIILMAWLNNQCVWLCRKVTWKVPVSSVHVHGLFLNIAMCLVLLFSCTPTSVIVGSFLLSHTKLLLSYLNVVTIH